MTDKPKMNQAVRKRLIRFYQEAGMPPAVATKNADATIKHPRKDCEVCAAEGESKLAQYSMVNAFDGPRGLRCADCHVEFAPGDIATYTPDGESAIVRHRECPR